MSPASQAGVFASGRSRRPGPLARSGKRVGVPTRARLVPRGARRPRRTSSSPSRPPPPVGPRSPPPAPRDHVVHQPQMHTQAPTGRARRPAGSASSITTLNVHPIQVAIPTSAIASAGHLRDPFPVGEPGSGILPARL